MDEDDVEDGPREDEEEGVEELDHGFADDGCEDEVERRDEDDDGNNDRDLVKDNDIDSIFKSLWKHI